MLCCTMSSFRPFARLIVFGSESFDSALLTNNCSPNPERANEEMHVHRNDVVKVMRSFVEGQSSHAGTYIVCRSKVHQMQSQHISYSIEQVEYSTDIALKARHMST